MRIQVIFCTLTFFSLLLVNTASAQLPNGPNVTNAWSQGTMDDLRVYYGYTSPEPDMFHCRVDYYHDGRIRLLAVEGNYRISNTKVGFITTFYSLQPTLVHGFGGHELVRISYKSMDGPNLKMEPFITSEDTFTKRCVPLLGNLFKQIPAQEVKMFLDQYGSLFGVK